MMLKPVQPKGTQDVPPAPLRVVKGRRVKIAPGGDRTFRWLTFLCSLLVPLVMLAIGLDLVRSSWPAVKQFGWRFFWSTEWNPVLQEFGAGSSIFGTLVSTLIAMFIAVPLSLAIALFLVELAPPRVSRIAGT
ncbi:MAG: phosphate ABC transporter permease subunit PstC, partial [Deltaproteobacteria bacterium]|nr:phosphate ABC transporter permease subunit PstC [Deltaproteobacteria bacterium]